MTLTIVYKTRQRLLAFFSLGLTSPVLEGSAGPAFLFLNFLISRTKVSKASTTLCLVLAEASKNGQDKSTANCLPKRGKIGEKFEFRALARLNCTAYSLNKLTFLSRDFSVRLQVAFVADKDERNFVRILNTKDVLVQADSFVEASLKGNGVHAQETITSSHVLISNSSWNRRSIRFFLHRPMKLNKKG